MKDCIYVMKDQVSGQYGSVFQCSNDADCIRSFKNVWRTGSIPDYAIRDTVIIKLAEIDFSGPSPIVNPVLPVIIFYGSEVFIDEKEI